MRPLNPVPVTRVRSTPSSRENLRTDGPACAREKPGSLIGGASVRNFVGASPGAAGAETACGALCAAGGGVAELGAPDDLAAAGEGTVTWASDVATVLAGAA